MNKSLFQVGRAHRKRVLFAVLSPFPTLLHPLAEPSSVKLREGCVSRGRWGRGTEADMSHLFNLLNLSLKSVCAFRKTFSDIGPVGRMTTK